VLKVCRLDEVIIYGDEMNSLAKLLDESVELNEVIADLIALYKGQRNMEDRPFQDVLTEFLDKEVIALSEYKKDLLLSRLTQAAVYIQATAAGSDTAAHNLARMLDNMRYAIYRRLQARTPFPPIRAGGAWF
jgi:hypothetical protein